MANLTKFKNTLHVKAIKILEKLLNIPIDDWCNEDIKVMAKKEPNEFLSEPGCGPKCLNHIGEGLYYSKFITMDSDKWVKRKSKNPVDKPKKADAKQKEYPTGIMMVSVDPKDDNKDVENLDGYLTGRSECVNFVEDEEDLEDIDDTQLGDLVVEYKIISVRRIVVDTVTIGDPE